MDILITYLLAILFICKIVVTLICNLDKTWELTSMKDEQIGENAGQGEKLLLFWENEKADIVRLALKYLQFKIAIIEWLLTFEDVRILKAAQQQ